MSGLSISSFGDLTIMTDFDLENPKPFILTCKDRKVKTEEDMCVHLTVEEAK